MIIGGIVERIVMIKYIKIFILLFSISFLFSQSNQQREVDKLTLIVSQKREIVKLKAKVSELEKKIEKLENNNSSSSSTNIKFSDKWKNISNWRKLRKNMSMNSVENLLGAPQRVDARGMISYWYYDENNKTKSRVIFDHDNRVYGWAEP
jgi:hypothetical protein